MLESWNDPHARHAMLVHWPIVLVPVAAGLLVWFAATGWKKKAPLVCACLALAGAMVGAGLAAGAGEEAYERVEDSQPGLTTAEDEALERHEHLGEGAWMWPGACLLLAGLAVLPKPKRVPMVFGTLALVGCLVVSGRFAWTAHTGGVLVYEHGLGVPQRAIDGATSRPAPALPERHGDDDDD